MRTLFRSGLFWLTIGIGAIGIGGMLIDLRLKIWLVVIAHAFFIVGPMAIYELIVKRHFGVRATCAIFTLIFIGIIFLFGKYQSEYAKVLVHNLISDVKLFQRREGRPPKFAELSELAGRGEPLRFLVPGVRVSYDWETSRGACLRIYQFPSNWLRTCANNDNDDLLKDDL